MAADFVPSNHEEFTNKFSTFETWLVANGAAFGFTPQEITQATAAKTATQEALNNRNGADTIARATQAALVTEIDETTVLWRAFVKRLQAASNITNAIRILLGLNVPTGTTVPVAVPTTAPIGRIEILNRHEQVVHFVDSATPTSKAKPAGVRGCQIWVKIGTAPPANASELHYLATDTRTPYVAHFDPADAGKTAYYWLRWVNTKDETGPWSAMISATITG